MENPNTPPEGTPEAGQQPEQQAQDKTLAELQRQIEFLRNESKEAFRTRDEVKNKLREFETAEEMKKGNYEKVIADKSSELEALRAEAEELKKTKEQFEKFQSSLKEELISQLPEEHKSIAGKLSLEDLREYVKLHQKKEAPGTETARAGGNANVDYSKVTDAKKLTLKELEEIRKVNPVKYNELLKIR